MAIASAAEDGPAVGLAGGRGGFAARFPAAAAVCAAAGACPVHDSGAGSSSSSSSSFGNGGRRRTFLAYHGDVKSAPKVHVDLAFLDRGTVRDGPQDGVFGRQDETKRAAKYRKQEVINMLRSFAVEDEEQGDGGGRLDGRVEGGEAVGRAAAGWAQVRTEGERQNGPTKGGRRAGDRAELWDVARSPNGRPSTLEHAETWAAFVASLPRAGADYQV